MKKIIFSLGTAENLKREQFTECEQLLGKIFSFLQFRNLLQLCSSLCCEREFVIFLVVKVQRMNKIGKKWGSHTQSKRCWKYVRTKMTQTENISVNSNNTFKKKSQKLPNLPLQGQKLWSKIKQLFVMFYHQIRIHNCRKTWKKVHLYPNIPRLSTTKIKNYFLKLQNLKQMKNEIYPYKKTVILISSHLVFSFAWPQWRLAHWTNNRKKNENYCVIAKKLGTNYS